MTARAADEIVFNHCKDVPLSQRAIVLRSKAAKWWDLWKIRKFLPLLSCLVSFFNRTSFCRSVIFCWSAVHTVFGGCPPVLDLARSLIVLVTDGSSGFVPHASASFRTTNCRLHAASKWNTPTFPWSTSLLGTANGLLVNCPDLEGKLFKSNTIASRLEWKALQFCYCREQ